MDSKEIQLVVVGAGPGGYAAAFYAADQGKRVILVEKDPQLGGVCLNRGCIPSKALLHATELIHEAEISAQRGISFGEPRIELDKLRDWKKGILTKLSQGIAFLAQKRGVEVITGRGYFEDSHTLRVETSAGQQFIKFEQALIATGSSSFKPRSLDLGNPRIMTSRQALDVEEIPDELLVIGGGYIGMELGFVYSGLGSQVTVIEALDSILAGADADLAKPVAENAKKRFKEIRTGAKVASMATADSRIKVVSKLADGTQLEELYDRVLIAVGRRPNSENLGIENTKAEINDQGFIEVDSRQRTADPNIYAIGDVVGGAMLAHKAHKEGRVAVENILGEDAEFQDAAIPAVVFTDPEVAWCGLTEAEAKEQGRKVEISKFPWAASGRSLTYDRTDGLTKLIIEPETERILGVGMVGHGAGELIAEAALAIEMGATAFDLAETVHPHPTLSETIMEAAEAYYGSATHVLGKGRKK